MSELFGAPSGIIAAQEQDRASTLSGLKAVQTMGEIAMQPAEMQYKKSLGRLHEAEAQGKEAEAAAAQQMLDLQHEWSQRELAARGQLIDGTAAQGREATAADLKGGSAQAALAPTSQADSLRRFADYAEQRGVPPMALAKLHKEIADISEKEAIGGYRNAQAAEIQSKQAKEQRQQLGGMAEAAANDPRAYRAMMMDPQARKILPPQLTGDYATDRPVLQYIAKASMTANEQEDNARADLEAKNRAARRNVGMAQANSAVALNKVRLDTAKEVLENLKKYGGPTAQATLDAKRTTSEARRAKLDADEAKAFPPMPLDPKAVVVGQPYTAPNGQKYTVVGRDAAGKPLLQPIAAAHAAALKAARDVANTAAELETADETGD